MTPGRYPNGFFPHMICREEVVELLRYLMLHPGCTRKQIMQDTQLTYSDVSQILPKLRGQGIITATPQRCDKRNKNTYSISGIYLPAISHDLGGVV